MKRGDSMLIDDRAVYGLIGTHFRGNVSEFAKALGVDRVTVWRTLEGHSPGTNKFIPALMKFCANNDLNLMDYLKKGA